MPRRTPRCRTRRPASSSSHALRPGERPEVAQGDRRAVELRGREGAGDDAGAKPIDLRAQRRRLARAGVAQHRDEESVPGVGGDAEADPTMQDPPPRVVVEPCVEGRRRRATGDHGADQAHRDVFVLAPVAHVRILVDRHRHDARPRQRHLLGHGPADPAQRLSGGGSGSFRRPPSRRRRASVPFRGALGLPRRLAALRRALDVGDADPSPRPGAGDRGEIDAERPRLRPRRRHRFDPPRPRRRTFFRSRRRGTVVRSHDRQALIRVRRGRRSIRWIHRRRRFTGSIRCAGAGGVRGNPRAAGAFSFLDLELDQGRTGRDRLAGPRAMAAHPAGDRRGDVHHRLRRFERDHRLVEGDGLAFRHVPLDDVRLGEPFTEVGEAEDRKCHGAYRELPHGVREWPYCFIFPPEAMPGRTSAHPDAS